MDEEVCYSSVSFIKSEESKTREKQDAEETVYSEVKRTEAHRGLSPSPAAADAKPLPGPHRYHSAVVALTDTAVPLPGPHRYRSVVVALGLLTALLLSLLVAMLVYYRIHVYESNALLERELHQLKGKHTSLLTEFTLVKTHNANLSSSNEMSQARYENASAANQHLLSAMARLQQVKTTLMMERDHLNQTLEVIFQFSDFAVGHFCPVTTQERKCSGYCKEGWEYYKSSCYHFIYIIDWYYWKSWEESKADCAKMGAHLVTIDSRGTGLHQ
ncbi:uncharacterized protein LOC116222358 [Clupea harengus]|uniref:Uncharacterized protein LOC116222358 n=1 Tax=Clupea harengus TaxID=7950 RepID=A0A8M1KM19_CLUHA|nr:uncharacterized protein LOC116222358 [Clupea harengus]